MSDVIATIDVMPITTPRTVSPERILFERTVSKAMTTTSFNSPTRIVRGRLLTAQGLDGIEPRGAVRGIQPEEQSDERRDDDPQRHGPRLNLCGHRRDLRDRECDGPAE